ncbi:MAG TPA: patatin family protein [Erysipelothrix sp.]|nr:patatin family protein [Erysipelothrix sp.]
MKKLGLVLEGGGMRGAYTAGCLAWMLENGYKADVVVGISSGSLYGAMYALNIPETMKKISIEKAASPRNSGILPIFLEGQVVGYNYMFDTVFDEVQMPMDKISDFEGEFFAGVYDLEAQDTIWISKDEMDDRGRYIKAACTLPVMGRAVKIDGKKYMDGGITTMIPLEKSIAEGCDAHIVVSTKSAEFVRKPQKRITYRFMRWFYRRYPKLIESFEARTEKYYEERELIESLEAKEKAINLYPSKEVGVGRFGGSLEQYQELWDLAFKDCEARRDEIDKIYHSVKG